VDTRDSKTAPSHRNIRGRQDDGKSQDKTTSNPRNRSTPAPLNDEGCGTGGGQNQVKNKIGGVQPPDWNVCLPVQKRFFVATKILARITGC
jgi:hypothetical protein